MKKRTYIIEKTVLATSIEDALKRERYGEITEVRVDAPPEAVELPSVIGFHVNGDVEPD